MVFFLTRTPEKKIEKRQLSIPIDDARIYNFPVMPSGSRINVTLEGAFLPEVLEQHQRRQTLMSRRKNSGDVIEKEKDKDNYLRIYLRTNTKHRQLTQQRIYAIQNPSDFDYSNSTRLPIMFDIGEDNLDLLEEDGEQIQLVIESNFTKTPLEMKQEMPLIFSYDINPINKQIGVIFAAFVLIFLYALIIWEVSMFLVFVCFIVPINASHLSKFSVPHVDYTYKLTCAIEKHKRVINQLKQLMEISYKEYTLSTNTDSAKIMYNLSSFRL